MTGFHTKAQRVTHEVRLTVSRQLVNVDPSRLWQPVPDVNGIGREKPRERTDFWSRAAQRGRKSQPIPLSPASRIIGSVPPRQEVSWRADDLPDPPQLSQSSRRHLSTRRETPGQPTSSHWPQKVGSSDVFISCGWISSDQHVN